MKQKDSAYFAPLTGVRAIAAFMVYIHHFNPFASTPFYGFFRELHVGVTFFFVLSGFLIGYRYSDMNQFSFKKYIANRVARIYPVYLILTTLTFLVTYFHHGGFKLSLYLLNVTFLRGFFDSLKYTGIPQGWSLTVEETFYFLAPLCFLLIKKKNAMLLLLPLFFMGIGVALVGIFENINAYTFFGSYEFMFNHTFFGRCFEFFIGIGLAILVKTGKVNSKNGLFTYVGIAASIGCIYLLSLAKGDADYGLNHPSGKIINTVILPLFGISFLYLGLVKENTIVSKILGSNLFVLLGKSSYVFYLIHMGVIADFVGKLIHNNFIEFIVINIISIGIFKLIEEPLNNLIRSYFNPAFSPPELIPARESA